MQHRSRRVVEGSTSRGRWPLALALAAAMSLWLSAPGAAATAVLDQQQTIASVSPLLTKAMAQTFTAGTSGVLDHVSLRFGPTSASGWVEIRNVDSSGKPTGSALGTSADMVSFASSTFKSPYYDFKFPSPISLTAGTQYAIVVIISIGNRAWMGAGINVYAGGQGWIASCSLCANWTLTTTPKDFVFQTWMTTSVNQAPVVAADNSTVTVNEGTAPADTGTFSDPDGDTVAITASAGTLTTSGTSTGTWAWTQPASDEAPAQTITVNADDGHGFNSTTTFAVTVAGVAPTASIGSATLAAAALSSNAPATSPEGTAVTLTGSASSPAAPDNSAGFAYSWTVTKNGAPYGAGTGSTFRFTPDDEGTFVASLKATDDGGMTGAASVTIAGGNVAPVAHIASITPSAPLVTTAQESLSFTGAFSDPGALDSHTVKWSFGDGSTATSSYGPGGSAGLSANHSYAAAGTYTLSLTVTDDDGGVGQASTKVVVQTAQQALSSIAAYVQKLPNLNAGQKNSLVVKLNAASASATRGDTTAAHNQLNAFLNELQADLNTGKVSSGDAATLRGAVHAVEAALGTYNRFLEWWPLEA